jgi:GTPase KRas
MRNGQGFLLVYSIIDKKSIENLNEFHEQILRVKDKEKVPMVIFGNKCDLESERCITKIQGEELGKKWEVGFVEGSAKAGINVNDGFFNLVREIKKEIAIQKGNKTTSGASTKDTKTEVKVVKKDAKPKKKGGCLIL